MDHDQLRNAYNGVKSACREDWRSDSASQAFLDLAAISLHFLAAECEQVELNSRVLDKEYFSFRRNNTIARPVNREFFAIDAPLIARNWQSWMDESLDARNLRQTLYTLALAPCLVMELFDRNNKKGPATYFECLIGHIFAKLLGVEPTKGTELPVAGRSVRMTMDFLFQTDENSPNIHLPVKMSTRERVVQAWSHQRLLNSAYGDGHYKGIMVLFSETKLDSRSREVVEICVPDQWLIYQTLLAKMDRIYYFDMPNRYRELARDFPSIIKIKPFLEFFNETRELAIR